MADNKPAGDNKLHQIVMAVITTIAAPVIVFYITNSIRNSTPNPTATATPAVTAVLPAATEKQTGPSPVVKTEPALQPTATGIANPSGTVPAGIPALVDGLALTVSRQDVTIDGRTIRVTLHIKNTGASQRELSFTPAAVQLKDDTRHIYEVSYGDKKSGCKKTDLGVSRAVTIPARGEITLASVTADRAGAWCADKTGGLLPLFNGPLGKNAKKLEVLINGVGPFKGFQVEIEL